MKINRILLCGTLFLSLITLIFAQNDSLEFAVMGTAKVKDNSIYLKWMVNNPALWKQSLSQGYKITRTTVKRNNEVLDGSEQIVLEEKLLPLSLAEFEQVADEDSMNYVVAQAIYGEDFEVESTENAMVRMLMLSEELQQRYAFAVMAMESSFIATRYAGNGYIDTTVKPGEKYVYTVELLNNGEEKVQEAVLYIGLENAADHTPPEKPYGIFEDGQVTLVWEYQDQAHLFSSYNLERSEDGTLFKKINEEPIFSWDTRSKAISYKDTLIVNNKTYYYRLRGIDTFGDESEPSEVFSGQGHKGVNYSPNIIQNEIKDQQNLRIGWDFPKEGEAEIVEFKVLKSEKDDGFYEVVKEKIPPSERSVWIQTELKPSNYFKVEAYNELGEYTSSYPTLVQPIDSIPPAPPVGMKGKVDTLGRVTLEWTPNTESDFYGYKVFRSFNPDAEYSQITTDILKENQFRDTISTRMMNRDVYYKFIAVDKRYNESTFSEALALQKPDNQPPSTPIISNYSVQEDGVFLEFILSTSSDVAAHELYRRREDEKDWTQIYSFKDAESQYLDKKVEASKKYYYLLLATDTSGNESEPSQPLIVTSNTPMLVKAIKSFEARIDRDNRMIELWWSSSRDDVIEFQLYKKKKGESYILYRIFEGKGDTQFTDEVVNPGNIYEYSIRALVKDGSLSEFKKTEVSY